MRALGLFWFAASLYEMLAGDKYRAIQLAQLGALLLVVAGLQDIHDEIKGEGKVERLTKGIKDIVERNSNAKPD